MFSNLKMIFLFSIVLFNCGQVKNDLKSKMPSKATPKDPLASGSETRKGLCGYLHTATLCTNDIEKIKTFYVDGMGMKLEGPIALGEKQKSKQRGLWKLDKGLNYEMYHLYRPTVPSLIQIRLLVFDQKLPNIHQSYHSLELGPFSLGFPNMDQKALDKKLLGLGIESMAPMQEGTIPRADGSEYRYWETIYKGPDYLHCVGIERGDGVPQLAPCDSVSKLGGPGYSAQVIDNSDHFISFLTEVLDLELRADRSWEASPGSALGISEGTPFRFALVYAKGTSQNHFLFLDFKESKMIDPGTAPRIPNNGLGAWTLETKNINQVLLNAKSFGTEIINEPTKYNSPIFGESKIMSMLAPNGFIIEVFEKI